MSVHITEHPLIQHKLTVLRNQKTSNSDFRSVMKEVTFYLGYEATRNLPIKKETISTGMCEAFDGAKIDASIAIIPILRAGLGMGDAMLELIPNAAVHHIGMYRAKHSPMPVQYYNRLPKNQPCDVAYILDPCIATSNTVHAVITIIKKWGAKKIVVVSVLASKDGLALLKDLHPEVEFFIGTVDNTLSDGNMVLPGFGDAGDRLFGTPNDAAEPNVLPEETTPATLKRKHADAK